MSYTIKQVDELLQSVTVEDDPFFIECLSDERKGVQDLIRKWQRKESKRT